MKKMSLMALLSAFGVSVVVGCGSDTSPALNDTVQTETDASAPDPHDIPLTDEQKEALRQALQNYPDVIAKIKSYRGAIRDAVSAGKPTQAHRPLDELDVVLEHMPQVARASNIPKTQWETVNTSAQALRDSFNKLHAQIDAGEQPSYEAVATDIDAAISRLESVPASQ